MGKSILGDDPFAPRSDEPAAKAAAAGGDEAATKRAAAKRPQKAAPKKRPAPTTGRAASPTARRPQAASTAKEEARAADAAATDDGAPRSAGPEPPITTEAPGPDAPHDRDPLGAEEVLDEAGDRRAEDEATYGPPLDDQLPPVAEAEAAEPADYDLGDHPPATPRRQLPYALLWKPLRALQLRDRPLAIDEFGFDPETARRLDPVLDFFYRRYFRVECEGLGHIPDEGRAILVANHSGTLPWDGAMLMQAVHRDHDAHRAVRPLVEDFVFHFPYLGTLMNRIGAVRACPENAERLLEAEQLVAVFPEGIKGIGKLHRERYQLQRFGRGGFVKLALRTDSPIVPTAIVGAEEVHPMLARVTWLAKNLGIPYLPITPTFPWLGPLGLLPLPSKWYILFGEPLYYNVEYGAEAASDRVLVNRLADQVRQRLQEMVDSLLARRRSVYLG